MKLSQSLHSLLALVSLPLPTPARDPNTHIIFVGANECQFKPPSITIPPGDSVELYVSFGWRASDGSDQSRPYSVTRGIYGKPYVPVRGQGELSSGWIADNRTAKFNTWTLLINDTEATWYYDCNSPSTGMVGVLNPPSSSSQTLEKWKRQHEAATDRVLDEEPQCLIGEKGGRLGHRKDVLLPGGPDYTATTTVDEMTSSMEGESETSTTEAMGDGGETAAIGTASPTSPLASSAPRETTVPSSNASGSVKVWKEFAAIVRGVGVLVGHG